MPRRRPTTEAQASRPTPPRIRDRRPADAFPLPRRVFLSAFPEHRPCTGGATSGSRCSRTRRSRGGSSRWRARTDRSRRGGRRHVCDAPRSRSPAAGRTPRPNAHDCVRVDGGRTRRPRGRDRLSCRRRDRSRYSRRNRSPTVDPGLRRGHRNALPLFARRRRRDHTDGNLAAPPVPRVARHPRSDAGGEPACEPAVPWCRCRRPRAVGRVAHALSRPLRDRDRARSNRHERSLGGDSTVWLFPLPAKSGDMRNAKIVCTIDRSRRTAGTRSATSPTRGCPSSG